MAWVLMVLQGGARRWETGHVHSLSVSEDLLHWMLMIVAMMLPLVVDPLRTAAFRSLRSRRHRAIGLFLVGYLALWGVLGLPVAWARGFSWSYAAGTGFLVAAIWAATPFHRRALVACHRTTPLAPLGWRADLDCIQFGLIIGSACAMSCWPVMFACALAGHSLAAILAGATIGAVERFSFRTPECTIATALATVAAFYFSAPLFG